MSQAAALTVLADNNTLTDRFFLGEPGFSVLIETKSRKILFDTGYSDVFIRNAARSGQGVYDLDYLVLSHGHLDHTGGLVHLIRLMDERVQNKLPHQVPELVAHPHCFYLRTIPSLRNVGSLITEDEARRHFSLRLCAGPLWLTDDLVFLGEIPHRFPFEETAPGNRRIVMPDGETVPDEIRDDSACACRTPAGLVIITGCSHAGICNITEYAREVCGEERVRDIVGGLHLLSPSKDRLAKTGAYLRSLSLPALHACHCTSLAAKIALGKYCPVAEVGAGMRLEY